MIVVQRLKNFAQSGVVPICIEMHKCMWNEEFRNFSCKDLCGEGIIYENPENFPFLTQQQYDRIKIGMYNVYPSHASEIKETQLLSNYVYVSDNQNGKMEIVHDARFIPTSVGKGNHGGKRFSK